MNSALSKKKKLATGIHLLRKFSKKKSIKDAKIKNSPGGVRTHGIRITSDCVIDRAAKPDL
jgi:hypothetical protein